MAMCPICKNTNPKKIKKIAKVKDIERLQCKDCETIFLHPEPEEKPKYDAKYNLHFFRPGDIRKAGIMAEKLALTALMRDEKPRILEIGPGNGLTAYLLSIMNFNIDIIELEAEVATMLKNMFGLNAYSGEIQKTVFHDIYHLVYAGQVIEHSWDPLQFLIHCRRILTKKGLLYIDTPDGKYAKDQPVTWHHFKTRHPYEHAVIFTERAMWTAATRAGFRIIQTEEFPKFMTTHYIMEKK